MSPPAPPAVVVSLEELLPALREAHDLETRFYRALRPASGRRPFDVTAECEGRDSGPADIDLEAASAFLAPRYTPAGAACVMWIYSLHPYEGTLLQSLSSRATPDVELAADPRYQIVQRAPDRVVVEAVAAWPEEDHDEPDEDPPPSIVYELVRQDGTWRVDAEVRGGTACLPATCRAIQWGFAASSTDGHVERFRGGAQSWRVDRPDATGASVVLEAAVATDVSAIRLWSTDGSRPVTRVAIAVEGGTTLEAALPAFTPTVVELGGTFTTKRITLTILETQTPQAGGPTGFRTMRVLR